MCIPYPTWNETDVGIWIFRSVAAVANGFSLYILYLYTYKYISALDLCTQLKCTQRIMINWLEWWCQQLLKQKPVKVKLETLRH